MTFASMPPAARITLAAVRWRWRVWRRFSHKDRTQLPLRLQLHDSKKASARQRHFRFPSPAPLPAIAGQSQPI